MASYRTIAAPAEGMVREKMSRFLAFAHPAADADAARAIITTYVNRYHDARHVCWAYRLGADGSETLSTDNGEPSGTAGRPILGQIRSLELTNVVVIVVRYFGGIKLGTSGLIAAYRDAARQALEAATVIEGREMASLQVLYAYPAMNSVMRIVKTPDITIAEQEFDNTCRLRLHLPLDLIDEITARLTAAGATVTPPQP